MAHPIFDIFPECFDTAQPFIILGIPIFRRRNGILTAYCTTMPLYADTCPADMTTTNMVDRGTYRSVFSEFNINTSQHFLFSRDPAFVSSSNDFFLSFQSHPSKIMILSTCVPSENTLLKERVDMNSTRSSLIVDLVNGVQSGYMRERRI